MNYLAALQIVDPNKANIPKTPATEHTLKIVLTDFFIMIGAIGVLILVIAGLRYIMARGNADKTTQAKNMMTYAVIGIIIAALASTIVSVVIGRGS